MREEILQRVVHKVLKHGVFLKRGSIDDVYLSNMKIIDYHYVLDENAYFMNDKRSRVGKDHVVHFKVIGTRWLEAERQFQVLVKLDGNYLGPISSFDI